MSDIQTTWLVIWIILIPINILVIRWVNKPEGTWTRALAATATICSVLIGPIMTAIFLLVLAVAVGDRINKWTVNSMLYDRWTDWWGKEMW